MNTPPERRPITKAVALAWDREHTPRVTAIGTGLTAEQILKIAAEHDIPLHNDPVLVEALAQVPLGAEIPRELYVAVAEVLAFIFLLAGIDPRRPVHLPADPPPAAPLSRKAPGYSTPMS
ncbi:type III secretion protein [Caldichromatium japonicum]|uniref:Flagellar biosynthetic protein FlhB n=1 Tax=Caldichromatium japonicum TaxID=2699430 RepID=A0A6G7VDR0_9GAMM|nr:EscU/YscU/HrcU family type III secretion system export apparatus switch protein [Caldichromatium japonicum]QIK37988.1 type III secretion protein [Caldichromatium japonicum]